MSVSGSQPLFRTRTNESMRKYKQSRFSQVEDDLISMMVNQYKDSGQKINWSEIASKLSGKTGSDVSHRWNVVINPAIVKGHWTPDEDLIIIDWVKKYGASKWSLLQRTHLEHRSGKQLRERWVNIIAPSIQLHGINMVENVLSNNNNQVNDENPDIDKVNIYQCKLNSSSQPTINKQWQKEEDDLISELYHKYGPKWKLISSMLNGRSENSVKNRWQSIKTKNFRVLEGKEPLMKRGPKNKERKKNIKNPIDRSALMMKNNEQKFSIIPPFKMTEVNDYINTNSLDDFEIYDKENQEYTKSILLLSPTPIPTLTNTLDFDFSFDNNPISPPFKLP